MSSTLPQRITIPERVLFRDLGEEGILLELDAGQYFGLDEVGCRIWRLLEAHGSLEPVLDALLDEYEVTRGRLEDDLSSFVSSLAQRRLVDVHDV